MELVATVGVLWERRIIISLGVVVAIAVGLLTGDASGVGSRGNGGFASMRLLLDTRVSQVVGAAPRGADTLPNRAALLADLLATDTPALTVARAAGVPDAQLKIVGPAATIEPAVQTPVVDQATAARSRAQTGYVVKAFADGLTPIISIRAYAPDPRRAGRLAEAAAAGLRALVVAADASRSRGFVLETVAAPRTRELTTASRRRLVMIAASVGTFGCWCACVILGVAAAARVRRPRSAQRRA